MTIAVLAEVFRDVLEAPDLELQPTLSAAEVEGWDSFNHINLILAIEERFNIEFTTEEIGELRTVDDLVGALQRKGCAVAW
jgi:acyl carrier protein